MGLKYNACSKRHVIASYFNPKAILTEYLGTYSRGGVSGRRLYEAFASGNTYDRLGEHFCIFERLLEELSEVEHIFRNTLARVAVSSLGGVL